MLSKSNKMPLLRCNFPFRKNIASPIEREIEKEKEKETEKERGVMQRSQGRGSAGEGATTPAALTTLLYAVCC
jgi:hypothetical protein